MTTLVYEVDSLLYQGIKIKVKQDYNNRQRRYNFKTVIRIGNLVERDHRTAGTKKNSSNGNPWLYRWFGDYQVVSIVELRRCKDKYDTDIYPFSVG